MMDPVTEEAKFMDAEDVFLEESARTLGMDRSELEREAAAGRVEWRHRYREPVEIRAVKWGSEFGEPEQMGARKASASGERSEGGDMVGGDLDFLRGMELTLEDSRAAEVRDIVEVAGEYVDTYGSASPEGVDPPCENRR